MGGGRAFGQNAYPPPFGDDALQAYLAGHAARAGYRLKYRVRLRSFDAVCHMVASGLGLAVLPKAASLPIVRAMKLAWRPLADPWSRRRLLVATPEGAVDEGVQLLADFLVAAPGKPRDKISQ